MEATQVPKMGPYFMLLPTFGHFIILILKTPQRMYVYIHTQRTELKDSLVCFLVYLLLLMPLCFREGFLSCFYLLCGHRLLKLCMAIYEI